jgi:hypothetical protein
VTTIQNEQWKAIPGYEGRYEVSDQGQVRSLSFMQRCEHGLRRTRERVLAQQKINSGYMIVHLHLDNVRKALLVHRLVAAAFCPDAGPDLDVNHKDGSKTHNAAANLEWLARTANHDHAVRIGLNPAAMRVKGTPVEGGAARVFDSQSQAALQLTGSRRNGTKVSACLSGRRRTAFGHTWEAVCE